jgi:hypothetical protein
MLCVSTTAAQTPGPDKPVSTSSQVRASQSTILEQYKIYAEMADRTSARRVNTNTIFVTLNTSVIALAGALSQTSIKFNSILLLVPTTLLIAQCIGWLAVIRSYQRLNNRQTRAVSGLRPLVG